MKQTIYIFVFTLTFCTGSVSSAKKNRPMACAIQGSLFLKLTPKPKAPYAVAIGAPPRPVVCLSLSLFLSLVHSLGSCRLFACNFAPRLVAPIQRHQYFVIVRNGSGVDRCLRSLSRSTFIRCCFPVPFLARVSRLFGGGASTLVLRDVQCLVNVRSFFLCFLARALSPAFSLAPASQPAGPTGAPLLFGLFSATCGSHTNEENARVRDPAWPSLRPHRCRIHCWRVCRYEFCVCTHARTLLSRETIHANKRERAPRSLRSALRLSNTRVCSPCTPVDILRGKETCGPAKTTRKDSRPGMFLLLLPVRMCA